MKYTALILLVGFLFTGVSCSKKVKPKFLEGKWKVVSLEDQDNPANNKNEAFFEQEPMTFEFLTDDNKYGQKEVFVYKDGKLVLCYYKILNETAIDMSDDENGREARAMLINRLDNCSFELRKAETTETLKLVRL